MWARCGFAGPFSSKAVGDIRLVVVAVVVVAVAAVVAVAVVAVV